MQHAAIVAQFAFIPTLCMLIGALAAAFRAPGPKVTSATQHFAAGVVFAAVAKELLPKLGAAHVDYITLTVGFSLGVLVMLFVKSWTEQGVHGGSEAHHVQSKWALIIAVAIDLFVDGLLIGVAFLAGEQGGLLITIALTIEIMFLGIAMVASLNQSNMSGVQKGFIILVLGLLVPLGAMIGVEVFSRLGPVMMNGVLAFGVAALLYLVTEELLVEAHEVGERPWITACFFLGFLIILLLES